MVEPEVEATSIPTWQLYFYYFIIASVCGYIYEYLLLTFYYHDEFVNQGPLHGPMLIIYGIGGVVLIAALQRLTKKPVKIWKINIMPLIISVLIALIVSVIEYIGHWVGETFYGQTLWDYSDKFLNLNGRICLEDTLRFVVLGLIALYIVVPLMGKLRRKITKRQNWILFSIVALVFLIDVGYSIVFPIS
ncbi:MAG: putative ABC transporter permease [Propionibacteriaceae bacterium]|nr:putative ABC transporter permease [Propionibacteriaceae bacterium]